MSNGTWSRFLTINRPDKIQPDHSFLPSLLRFRIYRGKTKEEKELDTFEK